MEGELYVVGHKVFCMGGGIVARVSTRFHINFGCRGQTVADPFP